MAGAIVGLGLLCAAPPLHAEGLNAGEATRLKRGETVVREQTFESGDRHYVGGITYTVVDASTAELSAMLEDVGTYRRVLPRTKRARLVGVEGKDMLIELAQGNALLEAEYTLRVRPVVAAAVPSIAPPTSGASLPPREGTREFRFWLDGSRPHGIDDAWGFFRLEPIPGPGGDARVLLTYGVLVDVGPGLVRDLFEERLRAALLSVPQLVRRYVAENRRTN